MYLGRSNIKKLFLLLSFSTILIALAATHAEEATPFASSPAEVEADEMSYIEKESTVIAKGNVEIKSGGRILRANEVKYNRNTGMINADGNISILDENGYTYYADSAEINDELTNGWITNLRGDLTGDAKFAARKGKRESATITVLEDAVFSPCKTCERGKKMRPLWQISASKVTMDSEAERMYYKNATLDLYKIPVLYTPYLSHATPGASRKSGFLSPTFLNITNLGFTLQTPYYLNIAPNMDAILEPMFTSYEGPVLKSNFRHLLQSGRYELTGSMTSPAKRDDAGNKIAGHEFRGHIEGYGNFDLKDDWSWGFEGKRSTDDTYLAKYGFSGEDLLTSRAFLQNMPQRNYMGAQVITFQGLNALDDPGQTPLIFPIISTYHELPTNFMNSRFEFNNNLMILERDEGINSRRISTKASWMAPYITDTGHVFELRTSIRADAYAVEDVPFVNSTKDGSVGRVIPEAKLGWSYPVVKVVKNARIFVEPIANVIVSPNGGNPDKIPNEDSQGLELSDINIFDSNHFTGLDRVEGGPRSTYGIRTGVLTEKFDANILFGQSYRATSDSNFSALSGLDDNFSDYVGRFNITDKEYADISYSFRIDKDDQTLRRNEVSAMLKLNPFTFGADYFQLDEELAGADKHELAAWTDIKITDSWTLNLNGRRDLAQDGGWISNGGALIYEDECFRVISAINRGYTRDREIEPATTITLKVELKGLGN